MFQNLIRERRQGLGLSQTKLARIIGVAGSTLSDLELGKRYPWPKARRELAKALKCTEDNLFTSDQKEGQGGAG